MSRSGKEFSFTDLIEAFPDIFGRNGFKRHELENLADKLGIDWDKTHGLDDGEGPNNEPESNE